VGKGGSGVGVSVGALVGVGEGVDGVDVATAVGVAVAATVGVVVGVSVTVGMGVSVGNKARTEGKFPVKIKPQKTTNKINMKPIRPIQIKVERLTGTSKGGMMK
jgi:hypothetical protein